MSNKVYLTPSANETLHSLDLSAEQVRNLDAAMTALGEGSLFGSRIVLPDATPGGGLRELNRGGLRVFFRHDPTTGNVMIADIRPDTHAPASHGRTEDEFAAAS
jgi:mRNA-degrading endonuclease RelE of RelBE toxin-antitoxin system